MPELNARDNFFDDLEKILFGALPDFTGRHGGGRMCDEHRAKPLCDFGLPNGRLEQLGHINNFLQLFGRDA